jgi:RNA polymerase sigma-70 factor, ECF subfamily
VPHSTSESPVPRGGHEAASRSRDGERGGRPKEEPQTTAGPARRLTRERFEAEVERLMGRLYAAALRMASNPADAEDLVAEALAKAWANLGGLEDPQRFEKWLFRILTNTFISERRRRRETPLAELEPGEGDGEAFSLYERLHQPFLLWWGDAERRFLDRLLRQDIERALDGLGDDHRLVVLLVEVQGFTYAEAAEALEVPVGTVRSRLSRARSRLQEALWRQARQVGLEAGGRGGPPWSPR